MTITGRTIILLLMGIPVTALAGVFGAAPAVFAVYNLILAAVVAAGFFIGGRNVNISAERTVPRFELGRPGHVTLTLTSRSKHPLIISFRDAPPESFRADEDILHNTIIYPGGRASHTYAVRPSMRGSFEFGDIFASFDCFGLCRRRIKLKCTARAEVYPDLAPMRKYRLLAKRDELQRECASTRRIRGEGGDCGGVREYSEGDDYRKVCWIASARAGKPISKIMEAERGRDVIIALDCGRNMISVSGDLSRFDHCVEAAAALAQLSVTIGDRVGLALFSDTVKRWISPGQGAGQVSGILESIYGVQPEYCEGDLYGLTRYILSRNRKRSLICVMSHLPDEDSGKEAAKALAPLVRRHAVLFASIQNPGMYQMADMNESGDGLYLRAAANFRMKSQYEAQSQLVRTGITCVSAPPAGMLAETVSVYLKFKRRSTI